MYLPINLQFVQLVYELARKKLTYSEPLPEFSTRPPNILESCLAAPFQTYGKKYLYPTFLKRVSILFYFMIKNHPFINGNKRVALLTLLTYLIVNGKWLESSEEELYTFTISVAESPADKKEETVKMIERFIRKRIKKM